MIKASIVFAVAHTAELAKNIASATKTMGLRPQISEIVAQIGPDAALAKRNAPPIQVYPAAELRSREMVGAAVETIVASRAATNNESFYLPLVIEGEINAASTLNNAYGTSARWVEKLDVQRAQ
jgi:hypothetical protein